MRKRRTFWRKCRPVIVTLLLLLLAVSALYARAGGAGGSSSSSGYSSGGGGGDGGAIIYLIFWMINTIGPIPTVIIIGGAVFIYSRTKGVHEKHAGNAYRNMPTGPPSNPTGKQTFLKANPDFDELAFTQKVRSAFTEIQKAWSRQDLGPVRRYISDGVYQRFSTQFQMMKLLGQENQLSDIRIHQVFFESFEEDGDISVINVGIRASMSDRFVCRELPQLNSGGQESFTEYWSFIRKGRKDQSIAEQRHFDMYSSNHCPKCDAPLPDNLGERGVCPYCNALVNSGEYDWVLAEITQSDDYGAEKALKRRFNILGKTRKLAAAFPDFSVQHAEDIASNAFFQITSAIARSEPVSMRRFTSDRAYEAIAESFPPRPYVYNRIYLNYAVLIGAHEEGDSAFMHIALRYSAQRIVHEGGSMKFIDAHMVCDDRALILKRKKTSQGKLGSALMHQCPACGAPLSDSNDTHCPYCSAVYNSGELEWVVDRYCSMNEYLKYRTEIDKLIVKFNPKILKDLYGVKDYAMNNLYVMAAADGTLAEAEREFLAGAAESFGFNSSFIDTMFERAQRGELGMRMPSSDKDRRKIIELMKDIAQADGSVSPEEQKLLESMEERYIGNGESGSSALF